MFNDQTNRPELYCKSRINTKWTIDFFPSTNHEQYNKNALRLIIKPPMTFGDIAGTLCAARRICWSRFPFLLDWQLRQNFPINDKGKLVCLFPSFQRLQTLNIVVRYHVSYSTIPNYLFSSPLYLIGSTSRLAESFGFRFTGTIKRFAQLRRKLARLRILLFSNFLIIFKLDNFISNAFIQIPPLRRLDAKTCNPMDFNPSSRAFSSINTSLVCHILCRELFFRFVLKDEAACSGPIHFGSAARLNQLLRRDS